MIANLNMYARAELDNAHAKFWALIRRNLLDVNIESPEQLSQEVEEFDVWLHPDLVLSQTCGMPYRNSLQGKVQLVGTPDYGIEGCSPGYYRSAVIANKNDDRDSADKFSGATLAFNQKHSQSGYSAAYQHFNSSGLWFESQLQTHSHIESARAVAEARADTATIDAVTWRLIEEYEPTLSSNLQVLDWTESTPGLPLITANNQDASLIFGAVKLAIERLAEPYRAQLGIQGIVRISHDEYMAVSNPPD